MQEVNRNENTTTRPGVMVWTEAGIPEGPDPLVSLLTQELATTEPVETPEFPVSRKPKVARNGPQGH